MDTTVQISKDTYAWTETRKLLTRDQTCTPNLISFGYMTNTRSTEPLNCHIHPNAYEFVIVVKGTQRYEAGGQSYPLVGGDVFVSLRGEPHGTGVDPQSVGELLWFQIEMTERGGFLGLSAPFSALLAERLSSLETRRLEASQQQIAELKRAFFLFAEQDPSRKALGHGLFITFLWGILCPESAPRPQLTPDIAGCIAYIRAHLHETIEIDDLLGVSGLSSARFKDKFRQQTGMTPREYINFHKIEAAKKMLSSPGKSVTQVAFALNFSSSNYFASVFRQFTGRTPKEYQRLTRMDNGLPQK